ncbi:MAG TPA: AsmA-like C-terminal region-containing protein [Pseudolabrys sp.]|nr:AsmA-like C-terminal region-containing protein [Pseudolabrys sp.]
MQTTLLSLAIAVIVALVAALVAPLFIDLTQYRTYFEAEARRLIGVEVHVTGTIDGRLLPTPRLLLNGVEIGGGADTVKARSLALELNLTPLLRGEWRASEMRLVGPQVKLALDGSGRVRWPSLAIRFDPEALSIEKLGIEDGRVELGDAASGGKVIIDRLAFAGEARSLLGPFKGEGRFSIDGVSYPYRLAAGRIADETVKLKLDLDPVERPLGLSADGVLSFDHDTPHFEGGFTVTRAVGIAGSGNAARVTQPWRMTGKLNASSASALLEQIEFQYGSDEQGVKLTGTAQMKFGRTPSFDGLLSARQIDLDKAFGVSEAQKLAPAVALRQIAEGVGSAFRPPIPTKLGIGIDLATLGGATLQSVRGDVSSMPGGWSLDRFEFRAPGLTQVKLSGRLTVDASNVAFAGPASLETGDLRVLMAWLEGHDATPGQARPLKARGDLALGSDKIGIERLKAEVDRESIEGRLSYLYARGDKPARLEAELRAPELDLDAAQSFLTAAMAGSGVEKPAEMALAFDIGRATIAGVTATNAKAQLRLGGNGLQIDNLSVADLGGANVSASGRLDTSVSNPRGTLAIDLDARDLSGITALLARFAPRVAEPLRRAAPGATAARLKATLDVGPLSGGAGTLAKVGVDGRIGALRVNIDGQASGEAKALQNGEIRVNGKLDADDGSQLIALLGLDRSITVDKRPGTLAFSASGRGDRDVRLDARLLAGGLDAGTSGTLRFASGKELDGSMRLSLAGDARVLRRSGQGQTPLPLTLTATLAVAGERVTTDDLAANIAGAALRGKLALTLSPKRRVEGSIDVDNIEAGDMLAAAIAMPPGKLADAATWSSEPFGVGLIGGLDGHVVLAAGRATITPALIVRQLRTNVLVNGSELTLDDIKGELGDGRVSGRIVLRNTEDGLNARAKVALSNADAAALIPSLGRAPIIGRLGFEADVGGVGHSPGALVGSLSGTGKVTLADAQVPKLDPHVFDIVTRAADRGLPIDGTRVADAAGKALDEGPVNLSRFEGAFAITAGQVKLANTVTHAGDIDVALAGTLDLAQATIDSRLTITGTHTETASGVHPDLFVSLKGPIAAPTRSIDAAALAGWLTLRAVEHQSKRLEAVESTAGTQPVRPPAVAPPAPAAPPRPRVKPPVTLAPPPSAAPLNPFEQLFGGGQR